MTTFASTSESLLSCRHYPVAIVGGGQAGLSASHHLKQLGIEHIVFERHRVGHAWRNQRWDSFCLVTPNWQCRLPNFPYSGDDPDGFMLKDEIVAYVEAYARQTQPPLLEGVSVTGLSRTAEGNFELQTSAGRFHAQQVIVATGGYDIPIVPADAGRLAPSIHQIHSVDYRNPEALPAGEVLVVGSGQSGVQIMEDLHLAGRKVHLCVGRAPRSPREYRGRDSTAWLMDMGYYELTIDRHPLGEKAREKTNHYMTGRNRGHEIDLRQFALGGVRLYGSLTGCEGTRLSLAADLRRNLDDADEVYLSIRNDIDRHIATRGLEAPAAAPFVKCWEPDSEPAVLDCAAAGITSIVWAIGFRPDYQWIDLPAFDGRGHPRFERGISPVQGLYFLGLPWLQTWGSGRFLGVGDDAEHLARVIDERLERARHSRVIPTPAKEPA